MFNFTGTKPKDIGVHDGKLAKCPPKPNCVSSYATNPLQRVEPLRFTGDIDQQFDQLAEILNSIKGITIQNRTKNYLYAECKSSLMGFIDDLEFYWDEKAGLCHVRSASRLGFSDMNVNRRRVEEIRKRLTAK